LNNAHPSGCHVEIEDEEIDKRVERPNDSGEIKELSFGHQFALAVEWIN
jgi:hypothetical protein